MNQMPDRFLFPQPATAFDDPLGPLPLGWGELLNLIDKLSCYLTSYLGNIFI